MYSIEFTEFAEKQFLKLDLNIQNRILSVLERIKRAAQPPCQRTKRIPITRKIKLKNS